MVGTIPALSFPIPAPPAPGTTVEVLPGIHWLSTSLPFRPHTTNLWLVHDRQGWTMVDCGLPLRVVREQIEAAWSTLLGGMPITRLIMTHHHPDHIGNCGWICERWKIVPTLTKGEYELTGSMLRAHWSDECIAFYQRHGLPESVATEFTERWKRHHKRCSPLPDYWQPIEDGDLIRMGDSDWQVIVARGHSPEQAVLYSRQHKALLAADQILPKTTSNVSLLEDNPSANPLASFLESNRRIAQICDEDALVLPSHNTPFRGLHSRIKHLERLRHERLATLEGELKRTPQTAADLVPSLFGGLYNDQVGFALGEVIAHLQYLVQQGRVKSIARDGRVVFGCV